ncbi:MAG: argininosuccinate lyase [Candidatus Dadabacteria bacterium]|nr:MAG: argininosuccinate lyase [Candidatus Dadabacteria bacterium]
MTTTDKAWGGRFSGPRHGAFDRLNASIAFDWRLAPYDLWQNRVYADELHAIGVLNADEIADIRAAIEAIEADLRHGKLVFSIADEDIHMNLERELTRRVGDAGKRIHTGRSRNDQVATVFRLWLRDGLDLAAAALRELIETTLRQAERWADVPVPGYTHLQRAQIVTFGHALHAYAEMFSRDLERVVDARRRLNRCPLGSGALAASPYPVDRERLATGLGFDGPTDNSMDAVSDRDFAFESLSAFALCGLHLSRWAEDLILWMSTEFGWITLPDGFCTGSSIMPQKKNPDLAELARGKSGRLLGNAVALGSALKGLPLTYNKDLQEDKEPTFDTVLTMLDLLGTWSDMIGAMDIRADAMSAALAGGHLLATDLADHLVRVLGLPFREAHHLVGQAVRRAEELGCDVSDLPLTELRALHPDLDERAQAAMTIEASLEARARRGGPAPDQVRAAISRTRQRIESLDLTPPARPWAFELSPPSLQD